MYLAITKLCSPCTLPQQKEESLVIVCRNPERARKELTLHGMGWFINKIVAPQILCLLSLDGARKPIGLGENISGSARTWLPDQTFIIGFQKCN